MFSMTSEKMTIMLYVRLVNKSYQLIGMSYDKGTDKQEKDL